LKNYLPQTGGFCVIISRELGVVVGSGFWIGGRYLSAFSALSLSISFLMSSFSAYSFSALSLSIYFLISSISAFSGYFAVGDGKAAVGAAVRIGGKKVPAGIIDRSITVGACSGNYWPGEIVGLSPD
jgi:hypothetical protein